MKNSMKFEDWLNDDPCCKIAWHENKFTDPKSAQLVKLRAVFIKHKVKYSDLGCIYCYPASLSNTPLFISNGKDSANEIHNYQLDCFKMLVQTKVDEKIWLYSSALKNSPNLELLISTKIESLRKEINKDHELELLEGFFFAYSGSVCKALNEHFEWAKNNKGLLIIESDIGQSFIETSANLKFIEYLKSYIINDTENKNNSEDFEDKYKDDPNNVFHFLNGDKKIRMKIWQWIIDNTSIKKNDDKYRYVALLYWMNKRGYFIKMKNKKGIEIDLVPAVYLKIGRMFDKNLLSYKTKASTAADNPKCKSFENIPTFIDLERALSRNNP